MAAPYPAAPDSTHYADSSTIVLDVTDFIFEITPLDTPFFDMIGNGPATQAPVHQWQQRALTTRGDNAKPEGGTYTFTAGNRLPSRKSNFTQIMTKEGQVSGTQMANRHYGISNFEADQIDVLVAEQKTDTEHVLLRGTAHSGNATDTSRRMNGLIPIIQAALSCYTNASGLATISESHFNSFAQNLWQIGARPRDVLVGGVMKRAISQFRGLGAYATPASEMKVVNVVDTYTTDFGTVQLHLSRDILSYNASPGPTAAHGILWVDKDMLKKAWHRTPVVEKAPKIGDANYYVCLQELTLEYGHEHGCGFMLGFRSPFTGQ